MNICWFLWSAVDSGLPSWTRLLTAGYRITALCPTSTTVDSVGRTAPVMSSDSQKSLKQISDALMQLVFELVFSGFRPTLSLQELLWNFERSATPGGVPAVRWICSRCRCMKVKSKKQKDEFKLTLLHVVWFLQRFSPHSEDQSERNPVPAFWHHHPPQKTGNPHLFPRMPLDLLKDQ